MNGTHGNVKSAHTTPNGKRVPLHDLANMSAAERNATLGVKEGEAQSQGQPQGIPPEILVNMLTSATQAITDTMASKFEAIDVKLDTAVENLDKKVDAKLNPKKAKDEELTKLSEELFGGMDLEAVTKARKAARNREWELMSAADKALDVGLKVVLPTTVLLGAGYLIGRRTAASTAVAVETDVIDAPDEGLGDDIELRIMKN